MNLTTSLMVIVLLVIALLVTRRKQTAPPEKKKTVVQADLKKSTPNHAVAIKLGADACDAARQIANERYLSDEAPRLPLNDCDGRECHCKFKHYADRRLRQDRRSQFASGIDADTGVHRTEKREYQKDRRED